MSVNATSAIGDELSVINAKFLWTSATDYFAQVSTLQWIVTTLVLLLTFEQVNYLMKKEIWPIIGPFLESLDPKFDEYKAKWDSGDLSCVAVFHKFVVIASTRELSRKILSSPKYLKPCLVDVAIKILRPSNWVFLDGQAHVDYRKSLNGLFTTKALEDYIPIQEKYMERYLSQYVEYEGARQFFPEFRELLCALSLRTFCGDYINDEQIKMIADNYFKITSALELVNFPIIIPYTKTWYGKKIADDTMKIFEKCADKAKIDIIENNRKPSSLMEKWIFSMKEAKSGDQSNEETKLLSRDFTSREISEAIFTFLFASQDASSSLACWLFQIVADRPDVAQKIREEQLKVRNNDLSARLDLDLIGQMNYTSNVVKECLRYRPPVLMVPYLAKENFPITKDYTVPKGSMIIPSFYPALHDPEVYPDPDEFIPDRWYNATDEMTKRNWLVFGYGSHACIGKNYVLTLFTGMLGKFLLYADLIHHKTELSEEIKVFATIFPKDDLILEWKKRDPLQV
ncbi:cytochrome P450 [Yamadazyma tenuis ATCC 10573]|uniref:C-22 sterol desaturase ERG5 n=1 Tax=Candida tenuis (strain ATCC 10573 / BCRC 21748 / CBS 615 / JCM 9827 / NBRC 10315 / NRRL Y-1498 / VKM Y-70) TaxID=590646 RepID=G3B9N7_CANTC|nr:cytochrome P450 [Yamadazyma tenuis ATCC 10573]EGV62706.1 cytochrome P450 [Yamadazyma tenuis ATCC 10573]